MFKVYPQENVFNFEYPIKKNYFFYLSPEDFRQKVMLIILECRFFFLNKSYLFISYAIQSIMNKYDFLVIGAGIFGMTTAIELKKKNYSVAILNPDQIPHPLAASTDISKIIRMEYGTDLEYMEMAIESLETWREWNDFFKEILFHEVGFLLTSSKTMEDASQTYEKACFDNLLKKGFHPERLLDGKLEERFPVFMKNKYLDGFFHAIGGFAESGRVVATLAKYARQLGIKVEEGQTAEELVKQKSEITAVKTKEGAHYSADQIIVSAGNFTPYLIPDLKPFMKVTGHPVFHLKPSQPDLFTPQNFAVFAADISNTGWYGFPLHPREKVVKVALHSYGLELHPEKDELLVTKEDVQKLRTFLKESIPALANDPIVYTRRCCYTDTLDGHFWIDRHPTIKNLTIGSGGSGHGFKMGPIIGKMIATVAAGGNHKWSDRYKWRNLNDLTIQSEEARFLAQRSLTKKQSNN